MPWLRENNRVQVLVLLTHREEASMMLQDSLTAITTQLSISVAVFSAIWRLKEMVFVHVDER